MLRKVVEEVDSTVNMNRQIRREFTSSGVAISLMLLSIMISVCLVGAAFFIQHTALAQSWLPVNLPSPANVQSEEGLARGKFLVASRQLRDPNFFETVVLLIEYGRHGAMGLVINRPTELRLSRVLPGIEGLEQRTETVYIGGPVARSQMMLLIRSGSEPEESRHIFGDIYFSSSRTVLERMIDDSEAGESFRVYAGHAGWAPEQLDQEVSRGSWHVLEADAEAIFNMVPSEIWPELIRRSSVLFAAL